MKIVKSIAYSSLEVLTIMPLFLWFNHLFLSQTVTSFAVLGLFIVYSSAALLGHVFISSWTRVPVACVIAYFSTVLIDFPSTWQAGLFSVVILVMSIRGFYYSQVALETVFSDAMMWVIATPTYFISYFLFQDSPYMALLTWGAVILMIALLFITNKSHLRAASSTDDDRGNLPQHIQRQNQWYLVGLLVVILIMTRFNFIAAGIIGLMRLFFGLLNRDIETSEETMFEDQTYQPPMPQLEVTETPPWIELLELMLTGIAYGALFIGLLFIFYLLIKRMPKFGPAIQRIVKQVMAILFFHRSNQEDSDESAYIDEKTSVFSFDVPFRHVKQQFNRTFKHKVNWQRLDNRMKVRYLFQVLMAHQEAVHDPYRRGETAREFIMRLNDDVIAVDGWRKQLMTVYEQARYSPEDIQVIDEWIEAYERKH